MEKSHLRFSFVVRLLLLFEIFEFGFMLNEMGNEDGSERWGYVEVRDQVNLFWWYYRSPNRTKDSANPWPVILWLQGGPDSPAGTGFSYVNDPRLLATSDEEAALDLTKLLIQVFNACESLPMSPLYIVGESYGGKHAAILALNVLHDLFWVPHGYHQRILRLAKKIEEQVEAGDFVNATSTFWHLTDVLLNNSWGVDIYNFMLDAVNDPLVNSNSITNRYTTYSTSSSKVSNSVNLNTLMNGVIREKLKIIPPHVIWKFSSDLVFNALAGEFMKPRIYEVDILLEKGVPVTIYSGQLDVICSPKGTEAWVKKLKWEGLQNFMSTARTPIAYTSNGQGMLFGFEKSHENLSFYWILGAGHFVPAERPFVAMEMIGKATNSPAPSL
ncbi:serine carboxypeptidase-like 51 [Striga asiatica]|uniref:Carboxypeptidase n=1 Tax=Striga asiatica TaxID=4170 RepID=A0A5A7Q472_STRAF|nr:serine carboxypeptidase-like 51 [Striga asiatica]